MISFATFSTSTLNEFKNFFPFFYQHYFSLEIYKLTIATTDILDKNLFKNYATLQKKYHVSRDLHYDVVIYSKNKKYGAEAYWPLMLLLGNLDQHKCGSCHRPSLATMKEELVTFSDLPEVFSINQFAKTRLVACDMHFFEDNIGFTNCFKEH